MFANSADPTARLTARHNDLTSGNSISFWEFTRKGIVITTISTALCALYLWLRYFVLA